ncbi:hypothetical protein BBP00_00004054 [Phytophthora kernoviae]|uniref:Methyltransferase FkbM domain-containing protein n=1 Tax=Phytophthora kernoviae TaxID=325452 RepID=A0A3F2RUA6_9STRA|nr:hypothetical protein BBP00_00004054 [Phytophthora kernoviae]
MAQLAIRESVVNVSLDRSLAYNILIKNHTTQEEVNAPEPLVGGIIDLVARDWGCDDPVQSVAREEKECVEIPIILDELEYSLKLDTSTDIMTETARVCIETKVDMSECAALFRLVHDRTKHFQANVTHDDEHEDDSEYYASSDVTRRLFLDSPVDTHLYPQSDRIYVEPKWEQSGHGLEEESYSEEVCLYFEYAPTPVRCVAVPLEDILYITSNAVQEGYHLLYLTDKSGEKMLAATMFQVVLPKVELLDIYTSKAEGGENDNEILVANIRTTLFDPFDPAYYVCVMIDNSFECLDSEWIVVDTRELQHGTQTESFHQSVTFRAPLDHATLEAGILHEISLVLLTKNNKALALSDTMKFNAAPTVNRETSRLHVLDTRVHTPQRPQICPEELLTVGKLRWLCELWRHEWGIYSQNGEDGILREIFSRVGVKQKAYVEFGSENGNECNTRYLRESAGWRGLLMDSRHEDESIGLYREFITRENLMPLLADKYKVLVPHDLDLLSIDVDFNDYWLLNAMDLTRVRPRVIIVEVNSHIPASEARTVEYDSSIDGSGGWDGFSSYFGGSVAAFHHWGTQNGYSLVYCESHGVNCFLVRNDVLSEDVNVSTVLGPEQLQNPPNFFGRGWFYPNTWQPHHKWVWL